MSYSNSKDRKIIKKFAEDNKGNAKLLEDLLTELVETENICYNDESDEFYWESCGENIIRI